MRRGRAADDAGEDDEADAVADALLGDQLAEPHQDDGAGGQRGDLGQRRRSWRGRTPPVRTPCALRSARNAVGLEDRHRDGQVAGVLVDLVAAVLTLAAERLERGDDARHQLHDDRGVDVRVHPQRRRPRTCDRPPPENRSSSPNSGLLLEELLRAAALSMPGTGTGASSRKTIRSPEDEQDPAPDVRRPEGVQQGFEHGSGVAGGGLRVVGRGLGLGGGCLVGGRARVGLGRLGAGRLGRLGRLRGGGLGGLGGRRLGRGGLGRVGFGSAASASVVASASTASARPRRRRRPSPRPSAASGLRPAAFGSRPRAGMAVVGTSRTLTDAAGRLDLGPGRRGERVGDDEERRRTARRRRGS